MQPGFVWKCLVFLGTLWILAVSLGSFFEGCLLSLCHCPLLWPARPGPGFASPACSGQLHGSCNAVRQDIWQIHHVLSCLTESLIDRTESPESSENQSGFDRTVTACHASA
ncbi:hypothetical protein ATANTOWER_021642, partial [Ataeniobius toweri]|nr:hypothetical protein [Ataeniobius toweri]